MIIPSINFRNIRNHRNSQNDGFEELTRQLVLADPPQNYSSIENRGPAADGGVEILVRFPDKTVWGWQSKYFLDSFGSSEVSQLKTSFRAALENFETLKQYYVAIPRNLSGHADGNKNTQTKKWLVFKEWGETEATKNGRTVTIELWDETYFVSKLQLNDPIYIGMLLYWFDEKVLSNQWFQEKFTKSLAFIGKRYRPSDHVAVDISSTIHLLVRDHSIQERIKNIIQSIDKGLNILSSLQQKEDKIVSIENHCIELSTLLEKFRLVLLSYNPVELYASQLSETINKLSTIKHDNSAYRVLIDKCYKGTNEIDLKTGKQIFKSEYSDDVRHQITEFADEVENAYSEFSLTEIKLLKEPFLLVDGEAGTGKSHLLAKEAENLVTNGKPALFVPARVLTYGDKPELELLQYLDIGNWNFENFLSALQAAALANDCPAFLAIDGINESSSAKGWYSGLPSLITQIKKFNRIAVCISVRSSYQTLCIRKDLGLAQISHDGFRGNLGEAAKKYLDQNKIERPSAPIFDLRDILYSPLFLSTAVDYMKSKDLSSFPRGLDSIATLMSFWVSVIEENIIRKEFDRIEFKDGKIPLIIEKFASEMAIAGSESINYELANKICEDVVALALPAKPSDRLIQRLIDEGLLLDYPSNNSDTGKCISFVFQKFSDYFIADAIIKDCNTPEKLANELMEGGRYAYILPEEQDDQFTGLRIALLALTPIRLKQELPLIAEFFFDRVYFGIDEFVSSLTWRHGEEISQQTVELLERQRKRKNQDDEPLIDDSQWFNLLMAMALLPNCPLNALYLKRKLSSLTLGVRDATWSFYLVRKDIIDNDDDWSFVKQLIDWSWTAPNSEIEEEKIHLVAITLALVTSTMDRQVRDCATKALASLLIKFPHEISALIDEFADWDDPYVRERVLAAAMSGVLYCDDVSVITSVAYATDRMVFQKRPVERHAWTRRYAQIIINHAILKDAEIDDALISRSTPPYASELIIDWPTKEQVEQQQENARKIYWSVITNGDFGRYMMGGINSNFSEVIRSEQPSLCREQEIELFGDKVMIFAPNLQNAYVKLISLSKKREESRFLCYKHILPDDLSEDVSEQETGAEYTIDQLINEAEISPPELKQEYQRLESLRFKRDGISMFSLLKGQYWVFNRTLELGWQQSLHENIDNNHLRDFYDRHAHHVERIGKKYQHIARMELIGYLADYHWYVDGERKNPGVLDCLENFERADIDPTYLSGIFSKPIESYILEKLLVPKMTFVPDNCRENMDWTDNLTDIPDPIQYFIHTDTNKQQWCLHQCFCRSKDYRKAHNSNKPFRNAQYEIELILVEQAGLDKLKEVTPTALRSNESDVFGYSYFTSFLGQISFRHQISAFYFSLPYEVANVRFGRITKKFSPKCSGYDNSGVLEEKDFLVPHSALLTFLKLRPHNGWSNYFVTDNGAPAFVKLGDATIIRRDLIEKFAMAYNLKIVWRVWVEKEGGLGTNYGQADHNQFSRKDYLGYFFEREGKWEGKLSPYRH